MSTMQHPHYISVGWFSLVIRDVTRSAGEETVSGLNPIQINFSSKYVAYEHCSGTFCHLSEMRV